ncbi:MAG TPA: hypothetical protein VI670_27730, partial [Thermoanaerobaculia bacterium]
MRPGLYLPQRKVAPFQIYSTRPALGVQKYLLSVGLFASNNGLLNAGITSYIAQMGSQLGMHQADLSLAGGHDIQGAARCLFEGIAYRGTNTAQTGLLAADVMTEYRTDGMDSNGAQVFQCAYMQFQCAANATPGIVPCDIFFGTMDTTGTRAYRWVIQQDGRLIPFADALRDIGWSGGQVRDLYLSSSVKVANAKIIGA